MKKTPMGKGRKKKGKGRTYHREIIWEK